MSGGTGELLANLLGVLAATAVVLALAWAILRAVRKVRDTGRVGDPAATLRFVRALPLGQRERVVLIDIRAERLLLGVAEGGVTLLARWPSGDGGAERAPPAVDPDSPA